ncbi:MAG: hypothetical protein ACK41E_08455 [Deinococcales bacterium]
MPKINLTKAYLENTKLSILQTELDFENKVIAAYLAQARGYNWKGIEQEFSIWQKR